MSSMRLFLALAATATLVSASNLRPSNQQEEQQSFLMQPPQHHDKEVDKESDVEFVVLENEQEELAFHEEAVESRRLSNGINLHSLFEDATAEGASRTDFETADDTTDEVVRYVVSCVHGHDEDCEQQMEDSDCDVEIVEFIRTTDYFAVMSSQPDCLRGLRLVRSVVRDAYRVPMLYERHEVENDEMDQYHRHLAQEVPYGIDLIMARHAWSKTQGNGAVACVVDTGVKRNHADLTLNKLKGSNAVLSPWYSDGHGHGTHVSGTIAAANNANGVVGVAPLATVFSVKVFDSNGDYADAGGAYASTLIAAGLACRNGGANVINMSLGGSEYIQAEEEFFQGLFDNHNIISVASSGNSGNSKYGYPASYKGVISVGAVDSGKKIADFSTYNDKVNLVAPGVQVKSLSIGGSGYVSWSGTSMSAPHVTGVTALMYSYAPPNFPASIIQKIMEDTAEDRGSGGYDAKYGNGLVNAHLALNALKIYMANCPNGKIDKYEVCDGNKVGCNSFCVLGPYCGDGVVDPGEECDDGNNKDGDGCSKSCKCEGILAQMTIQPDRYGGETTWQIRRKSNNNIAAQGGPYLNGDTVQVTHPVCIPEGCYNLVVFDSYGDGMCCDEGNGSFELEYLDQRITGGDFGKSTTESFGTCCGDGKITGSEQCDGGSNCSSTCQLKSFCGDGVIDPNEECDDSNQKDGDGCSSTCKIECGNGKIDGNEECDDNNRIDGDGCSSTCEIECGNGKIDGDEECDDNNRIDGDGCSSTCEIECGNGKVDGNEECDDNNRIDGDGCSSTCEIECGNGNIDGNEECDDNNRVDGDGCSSTCEIECGNGKIDGNEECDDNNRVDGDGCSAKCKIEKAPANPASGNCNGEEITVILNPDDYITETSWSVINAVGNEVMSGGNYNKGDTTQKVEAACLPSGCYQFSISDSYGDGLCCDFGQGSYSVQHGSETINGAIFSESESHNIGSCDNSGSNSGDCKVLNLNLHADHRGKWLAMYLIDQQTGANVIEYDYGSIENNAVVEEEVCIDPLLCYRLELYRKRVGGLKKKRVFTLTYDGIVTFSDSDFGVLYTEEFGSC